ncbi:MULTISPECIES: Sec-independent protein translocase protein TatB [unclassified Bosea (in: a-proteobacteria)]|uniref:Sec-independent protein translocase protein TatB n=1 Tax=unclassified Bosea (in: a-proteobacteria) TaxID=2653178 RepID=UPI000953C6FC|nr:MULTISPECIES: Sec-independent protein translocase protein TatB [unclassified Bosea (in: a-proteobacteria)]TAJ27246.1 MAG: twin-arginine translocase subunit TatB [Bosea sp. (in: a-proteobacteria)]SIQ72172.1 sec-independent protein translocase protein TatB [Bosea sp. TND4EK4]
MFDIAWSEMVLIGAVALVVIGPKDLPKVLRTVGQTIGKVRRMATEFQGQFNEAMREAELADLKKQVEDVGGSVSNNFNSDYKPIDQPKEFAAPSTAETAKAEEEALKQAEAKLADLPMPELPPLDIAAETPTPEVDALPAAKPKRARKAKAEEPAPELAQPEQAAAASPEPEAPAKPARKRSVKVVTDAPEEADTPFPEVTAVAEPAPAKPVRRRKPKADTSAETKNEENSA